MARMIHLRVDSVILPIIQQRIIMYRLIYKSKSVVEVDEETVKDILRQSKELNKERGVTGALLATKTHFLQALEGDFKAVNYTFAKIFRDPRHEEIDLISFGPCDRRLFKGWVMKGFGLFNLNLDLEKRLEEKYGEEDGGLKFPVAEWAALSLMHDIKIISDS